MNKSILGRTKIEPEILHINIWNKTKNINEFINLFSIVDTHETLHKVIIEVLGEEQENLIDSLLYNIDYS